MNKIIEIAREQVGYSEFPFGTNKTKYGKWFGLDGVPWCGIFVSWVYHHAGKPLGNIGFTKGFAGCQTAGQYFFKHKMVTDSPVVGDIVLFDWQGDGRFDHTGIFEKWIDDDTFQTIEGNTSVKNQSNGGSVMVRKRNKRDAIFVHVG